MSSLEILIGITAAVLLAVTLSKTPVVLGGPAAKASAAASRGYCQPARTRSLHSWWVASPC